MGLELGGACIPGRNARERESQHTWVPITEAFISDGPAEAGHYAR